MCIKRFFMRFRKAENTQPQEPETRERKRELGKYRPKTPHVRISNIGAAAGVTQTTVRYFAEQLGIPVYRMKKGKRAYLYCSNAHAIAIHSHIMTIRNKA